MKLLALVGLGLVISGCGLPMAPRAASSSSPSATPSSSFPKAALPSCELPLIADGKGGFLSLPAGTFKPDPKFLTGGSHSFSYDRPFSRWLGVPDARYTAYLEPGTGWRTNLLGVGAWVSPDGARYAFTDYLLSPPPSPAQGPVAPSGRTRIHLVDLATGSSRILADVSGLYGIVAYAPDGIYLYWNLQSFSGLWLVDPATGSFSQVNGEGFWQYVGGGAAWAVSTSYDSAQPLVQGRILRLDLKTRAITASFSGPDPNLQLLGLDKEGHPIVAVPTQIFVLLRANAPQKIYDGSPLSGITLLSDTNGTWFGTQAGTYLYRAGAGLTKVSDVAGQVAGSCG
jgi:hypothetical protein